MIAKLNSCFSCPSYQSFPLPFHQLTTQWDCWAIFSQCSLQYIMKGMWPTWRSPTACSNLVCYFFWKLNQVSKCYPSSFQYSTKVYYHPWRLLHPPLWTYFVPKKLQFFLLKFLLKHQCQPLPHEQQNKMSHAIHLQSWNFRNIRIS